MYAVVIKANEDLSDTKIFERQSDAASWFATMSEFVGKGGFRCISMYALPNAANVREAFETIQEHDDEAVILLHLKKAGEMGRPPRASACQGAWQAMGLPERLGKRALRLGPLVCNGSQAAISSSGLALTIDA